MLLSNVKKLCRTASAMLLTVAFSLNLGACARNVYSEKPPTTAVNVKRVKCSGWKEITYSSVEDTPETVEQVEQHNAFGAKVGCWKKK